MTASAETLAALSAGALPPAALANVVLCLDRMDKLREIDPAGNTITVEAGCTLAAIQQQAAAHGRLFPMAPGSQGSCQIGGNISTNAGNSTWCCTTSRARATR